MRYVFILNPVDFKSCLFLCLKFSGLTDFTLSLFIFQCKKLRSISRHVTPLMVILRDGHLNLTQSGYYNFAITNGVH